MATQEAVKFLVEDVDEGIKFIKEGTGDDRQYYITGPFLLQEEMNRNNRIYPKSQMRPAVKSYMEEYVNRNRALGELNHPTTPTVNLDRAMLMTTDLHEDGNYYVGKARLLPKQPMGKIAIDLMNEGIELGVSSRATAKIEKKKGHTLVTENLRFHAIDMVADPSAHKAFVSMVMEDVDWVMDPAGVWQPVQVETVVEEIVTTGKKSAAELNANATKLFEGFMAALGKPRGDESYLRESDLKLIAEIKDAERQRDTKAVLIEGRKHQAGVIKSPQAYQVLARLHVRKA